MWCEVLQRRSTKRVDEYQDSYFPTVIRPVQQRLPLTWTAEGIAGHTVLLDLIDVTPESLPALDLATVFFRHSPAHVVAAVPLEPTTRIVGVDPAFFAPLRQRSASVDPEMVEGTVATLWR